MSQESPEAQPPQEPTQPVEGVAAATPSERSVGGSEGLFLLGAAIVVGGYILFGLLLGEYGPGVVNLTIATVSLIAFMRKSGDWAIPYPTIIGVIGLVMGVILVISVLQDLRFGFPSGATDNIANIVFYIGYLLMFLGGRGMKTTS